MSANNLGIALLAEGRVEDAANSFVDAADALLALGNEYAEAARAASEHAAKALERSGDLECAERWRSIARGSAASAWDRADVLLH